MSKQPDVDGKLLSLLSTTEGRIPKKIAHVLSFNTKSQMKHITIKTQKEDPIFMPAKKFEACNLFSLVEYKIEKKQKTKVHKNCRDAVISR